MELMKMLEILKCEGYSKEIIYNESEIKEVPSYPEDSYYFLVKENESWRFGYINLERGKNEEETIGIYESIETGTNSFFLDRLKKYYLNRNIAKAKNDTKIIELLIKNKLTVGNLLNALNQCNIPTSYISTQNIERHSISLQKDGMGWTSEYVDTNKISHKKTISLPLSECISHAFARIMYLYLLDKIMEKYFDGIQSFDYFTAEEIAAFSS